MSTWEVHVVPGLLQIPAYARGHRRGGCPTPNLTRSNSASRCAGVGRRC
ncbi:Scr1 family TA system antitoxin-like transcriptional regulator [Embleya scabrispora]